MLTSGDVVDLDLGVRHPAVVVTAQRILDASPRVLQLVPLTSTVREFASEVTIEADAGNGLDHRSAAQCQHIRAVSSARIERVRGNTGEVVLAQIRGLIGVILDIP